MPGTMQRSCIVDRLVVYYEVMAYSVNEKPNPYREVFVIPPKQDKVTCRLHDDLQMLGSD